MDESQVREDLLELIEGRSAHGDLNALAEGLPAELRGAVPEGQSHSAWGLIEHMRRAIADIVDFVEDPEHETPDWPAGFWPEDPAPPSEAAWDEAIAEIHVYLEKLRSWVRDESFDLAAAGAHRMARRRCGRCCWRRTTTRTTLGSSRRFGSCWACPRPGRNVWAAISRP